MPVKKKRNPAARKQIKLDKKHVRYVAVTAVVIVLLIIYFTGPRGTIRLWRVMDKKQNLENEIQELETTKVELDSIKNRLENDPEYLEKIAREEYNMKKEGEKVIKIETDSE
ncbi:MAG: septum formation initiator family protein [Calditrichaceae bacterium]|nr:septum formation initiator family protein [Calditrichaceae bacterium]